MAGDAFGNLDARGGGAGQQNPAGGVAIAARRSPWHDFGVMVKERREPTKIPTCPFIRGKRFLYQKRKTWENAQIHAPPSGAVGSARPRVCATASEPRK